MRVGSLFSGVGGIDLGLDRAGFQVAFQCEQDPYRREVLARHWPGAVLFEDVSEVTGELVRTHVGPGQIGLLAGGFPCQDLSVAGRRRGLQGGERSSLFFEFARIADALLGDGGWILIENVPGLLSSHGGRDFAVLLATLAELGFHDLAWRVLDSRHFGVPQRRRRVFILARRARGRCAREVLLEPEGGGGDFEAGREARSRVAPSLNRGSSGAGVSAPGRRQEDDQNIVSALDCKRGGVDDNDAQAAHLVAGTVRSHQRPGSNDSGGVVTVGPLVSRSSRGRPTPLAPGHNTDSHVAVTDCLVRRLTPSECEQLQGFPRGWTLLEPDTDWRTYPQPDGCRYAACGDAVTVPVAYWIGKRLIQAVERERVAG